MIWHHIEKGHGRPLILLHGIGMTARVWLPVMDQLALQRRVIAFDVPGFGKTAPLTTEPTVHNMVVSLKQCLEEMGLHDSVDIVGNSMGGYMALQAAAEGLARSVVALSPAGLWEEAGPPHIEHMFAAMRKAYRLMPNVVESLLKTAPGRTIMLAGAVAAKGWRVPVEDAIHSARMFAASDEFDAIFEGLRAPFTGSGKIDVPCTIAYGDFDWVFPIGTRKKSRAPAHSRWLRLPGCGHVPMWDNPNLVVHTILQGTH